MSGWSKTTWTPVECSRSAQHAARQEVACCSKREQADSREGGSGAGRGGEAAGDFGEQPEQLQGDSNLPEDIKNRVAGVKRKVDDTIAAWQVHTKRLRVELHQQVNDAMDKVEANVQSNISRLDVDEATLEECVAKLVTARTELGGVGDLLLHFSSRIHSEN